MACHLTHTWITKSNLFSWNTLALMHEATEMYVCQQFVICAHVFFLGKCTNKPDNIRKKLKIEWWNENLCRNEIKSINISVSSVIPYGQWANKSLHPTVSYANAHWHFSVAHRSASQMTDQTWLRNSQTQSIMRDEDRSHLCCTPTQLDHAQMVLHGLQKRYSLDWSGAARIHFAVMALTIMG